MLQALRKIAGDHVSTVLLIITICTLIACVGCDSDFSDGNPIINDNQPPVADFTFSEAYMNETTTFTQKSTDPDGDELSYFWSFGNNLYSHESNPSLKYQNKGVYSVRLIVTDSKGASDTCVKSIRVYQRLILNRRVSINDGNPVTRCSPITNISHQKNDERPGWQWTRVENTNDWHWQHDVKIESDQMSLAIHGNSDNHRIQIGEPAIYRTGIGYRLILYAKHDRIGDNPIIRFDIYIENGIVSKIYAENIRNAGNFSHFVTDLVEKGLILGINRVVNWLTGYPIPFSTVWNLLKKLFPSDWFSQYEGWQMDAYWFAAQVGDLYAKELPIN